MRLIRVFILSELRSRLTTMYGWLRPRTPGDFLCSCKESHQRKHAPGWRDILPALLAGPGAHPNSPRANYARRARHGVRDCSGTGGDARARHTGWKRTPEPWIEVVGSTPRSARQVPQPHREFSSETVFEPEARFPAPGELVERPVGRGTEEALARSGVCFFWILFFARAKKSNLPWVSHPQVIRGRSPLDKSCAGAEPPAISFSYVHGAHTTQIRGSATHKYMSPKATHDLAQRAMP